MSASASAIPVRSPAVTAAASSATSSSISACRSDTWSDPTSTVGSALIGSPHTRWNAPTWDQALLKGCSAGARVTVTAAPPDRAVSVPASGTVHTHQPAAGIRGQPAAVLDQETHRTGELIGLFRDDLDGQLLPGQVGTGKFETLGGVALVDVDDRRLCLIAPCLQLLE